MTLRYRIDNSRNLMIWWINERMDPLEFTRFTEEVSKDPEFRPENRVLAIFGDNLSMDKMNPEAMQEMQNVEAEQLGRRGMQTRGLGVAICPDDMTRIIMTLYSNLGADNPDFGFDIQICHSVAEAESILKTDLSDLDMPDYAKAKRE